MIGIVQVPVIGKRVLHSHVMVQAFIAGREKPHRFTAQVGPPGAGDRPADGPGALDRFAGAAPVPLVRVQRERLLPDGTTEDRRPDRRSTRPW